MARVILGADDLKDYSTDRLGLAWVRMNCFNWDREIFENPRRGWNFMKDKTKHHNKLFRYYFALLDRLLTDEQTSMYWWTIELGKTKEEWQDWYRTAPRFTGFPMKKTLKKEEMVKCNGNSAKEAANI